MVFFWLIPLLLLSVAAYFSAKLTANASNLQNKGRLILFIVFLSFCLGFFVTYAISHTNNLDINRFFYLFFASFIGLSFYLTAFSFLWEILRLTKIKVNLNILARCFIFAAFILFLSGLFNAFNPRIKNITVTLENLPDYWRGKKIVQLSDVHLGNVYQVDFLEKIVEKVNQEQADLILITGDLFDGPGSARPEFSSVLEKLSAKEGIFFISGNHDSYLGNDQVATILDKTKIKNIDDRVIVLNGLELIGLAYGSSLDQILSQTSIEKTKILLKHIPEEIEDSKKFKINLQLSGHTHKGQMFPVSFLTYLIYGHYHYGFQTEGGFNIYTSSGVGSWGPPIRTLNPSEIVVITLN